MGYLPDFVDVRIGGQVRPVRYGMNSIRKIEQETGKSITAVIHEVLSPGASLNTLVVIVWAGLLVRARNLTVDQVGDWLDETEDIAKVCRPCVDALSASLERKLMVKADEGEEGSQGKN